MDPYKKCLLNNQQPSLERFLCLGKFYYETEKTDQIDYSYYSYNSDTLMQIIKNIYLENSNLNDNC